MEAARRAGSELREYVDDQRLRRTSLVKERDVELVDMQVMLRDTQARLDEFLLSRDQQIGQHERELTNVRAKLEAKESELEAVRLRLTDAERKLAKSKLHTVTTASLVDLNEDRDMCELEGDKQVMKEKGIEAIERNEG